MEKEIRRAFRGGWLLLFIHAAISSQAALVGRWVASDLPDGPVATWTDRIASRPAAGKNGITKDSTGVVFNGNEYCEVPAANNPFANDTAFTITVVCKVAGGSTKAGADPAAGGTWWANSLLVGRELPGSNRGDFGLAVNSRNAALAGRGNPDGGAVSSLALNDGQVHVISSVFDGASSVNVFVDGSKVATTTGTGISAIEADTCLFGVNIVGNSDTVFFKGSIKEIQVDGDALSDASVTSLQNSLLSGYRGGIGIQSFTSSLTNAFEGQTIKLSWKVDTSRLTGSFSYKIQRDGAEIASGSTATNEFLTAIPDLAGLARKVNYTLECVETGGGASTASSSLSIASDPGIPTAFPQRDLLANAPNPLGIRLRGTDPNGGSLGYRLSPAHPPAKGMVTGTPPNVFYTPFTTASGKDSFGFLVNDGRYDSAEALVELVINPAPTAPSNVELDRTQIPSSKLPGDFVSNISSRDSNLDEAHQFELVPGEGAEDNANFTISGSQLFGAVSFASLVGKDQRVRIRSTDSSGLSLEASFILAVNPPPSRVVINEIHFNGIHNEVHNEFVELYNSGTNAVNLSGWRLSGAIRYTFPGNSSIAPHGFVVVAEDSSVISNFWNKPSLGPFEGSLGSDGETLRLRDATDRVVSEVDYKVGFPWPVASAGDGASMELIHPDLDESLGSNWRASILPTSATTNDVATPGAQNRQFATNAPPAIRQVEHSPRNPKSTEPVVIRARVDDPDGVKSVELFYQVVKPGKFLSSTTPRGISSGQFIGVDAANPNPPLPSNPLFENQTNWVRVLMKDDGRGQDRTIGDCEWTAVLPAQAHRTLVRYRIQVTDYKGQTIRVPYADDGSLNFAYFVHDGVPDYYGTPGSVLTSLPTYHLLTVRSGYLQAVGYNLSDRLAGGTPSWQYENWEGALVYDGEVYDHIRYRLHGGNGRYFASGNNAAGQSGKRSFKFVFHKGRYFQGRDNEGKKYPTPWKTMITENLWENRATYTFSLNEAINFRLWNELGVPAPFSHFSHLRTIMQEAEQPDPWYGDFWGLLFVHEDYDKQFLDAHHLPDGNLYKLTRDPTNSIAQQRHQGKYATATGADHDEIENNLTGASLPSYVTNHVNLNLWARYHALAEAIRHYDYWPSGNNNAAWYFYPEYNASNQFFGLMWTLPSDVDATWGPTWNNGHDVVHNALFNDAADTGGDPLADPFLWPIYHNQVREIRDLLWQPDQVCPLIDEYAAVIRPFVNAEFKRWKGAPAQAGNFDGLAGAGMSGTNGVSSLDAYVADMKDFAFDFNNNGGVYPGANVDPGGRAAWLDTLQGSNGQSQLMPSQPTLSFVGAPGFTLDDLRFRCSAFSDPQGAETFGGVQWRIAEVNATTNFIPGQKRLLEVTAAHDTGVLGGPLVDTYRFPSDSVKPGRRYRARVRHFDNMGIASKWSAPVEFSVPVASDEELRKNLMITEIMYHPLGPSEAEAAKARNLGQVWTEDDFEYLELRNLGTNPLDLNKVSFVAGVDFTFTNTALMPAGAFRLVVANIAAFEARYGTNSPVAGQWSVSKKLSNSGDTIRLRLLSATNDFLEIHYDDDAPWPKPADGKGPSLVLMSPETHPDPNRGENWRASFTPLGSPASDDRLTYESWAAGFQAGPPEADPDSDGVPNACEYYFGGNPKQADNVAWTIPSIETFIVESRERPFLVITFHRLEDAPGASYAVRFRSSLSDGSAGSGIRVSSNSLGNGYVQEKWRAPLSMDEIASMFGWVEARP